MKYVVMFGILGALLLATSVCMASITYPVISGTACAIGVAAWLCLTVTLYSPTQVASSQ